MSCFRWLFFAIVLAVLGSGAVAQSERVPIVVTPGSEQVYRIAVQRFNDKSAVPNPRASESLRESIAESLEFSNVFRRIAEEAYLGPVTTPGDGSAVQCSEWNQVGADALLEGEVERDPTKITVSFRVWDTARCRQLLRRRYTQPLTAEVGDVARRIGDDAVEAFIGLRGVAGTEIAFVSDRGGNKEIYVMNADGTNARAATANRSLNNFPGWSPDGDSIVYTSYRFLNRPFLFVSSRGRGKPGRVLAALGDERAQYRGVFGPEKGLLALVMSDGQASDIYTVRSDGKKLKRLTSGRAIEVSPTWSPDGSTIAFVSDRTGAPQIYLMEADGSNQRRLTFDGDYNTMPSWSPDGLWIAYETRIGGQFDIWLIDPQGSVNVPLVQHPRSDESPSWAPNSRKLVFQSTRRGRPDLYMIDTDGSSLRRLTRSAGSNTVPSWGPYPQ